MRKKLLTLILLAPTFFIHAQNVGINNTGAPPDASAMLDIKSTNKGLLIPRVALTATTDNTSIASPQISLLVYNTATGGAGNTAVSPGFYFWNGSAWIRINDGAAGSAGWLLTGNSGTNPSTHFIGTTDVQPLLFRINNIKAGIIDSVSFNTGIGYRTFDAGITGTFNTAIGYKAFISNTTGSNNTALGSNALRVNTTGIYNTASGMQAMASNTTGNYNTAAGYRALFFKKSGGVKKGQCFNGR
jgi:hypothetical protein